MGGDSVVRIDWQEGALRLAEVLAEAGGDGVGFDIRLRVFGSPAFARGVSFRATDSASLVVAVLAPQVLAEIQNHTASNTMIAHGLAWNGLTQPVGVDTAGEPSLSPGTDFGWADLVPYLVQQYGG